jgi:hypothetical protein
MDARHNRAFPWCESAESGDADVIVIEDNGPPISPGFDGLWITPTVGGLRRTRSRRADRTSGGDAVTGR